MYKQIEVQGYFRKDGTWVGKHTRKIKVSPKSKITMPKKYKNNTPNQLRNNFE